MTRNEEIKALADFINGLPEHSYLKPMLKAMQPDIERDIHCDYIPDPYPVLQHLRSLCKTQQAELDRIKAEISDRIREAREACSELAEQRRRLRAFALNSLPEIQRLQTQLSNAAHIAR